MRQLLCVCLCLTGGVASAWASSPKPPDGMVWIPGGEFQMGSEAKMARPDERPVHRVKVDGFFMDATEVTNAEFKRFVDATGYLTTAEVPPKLEEIMAQLPAGTPPAGAREPEAGLSGVHVTQKSGRVLVEMGGRRQLAPPDRPRQHD